MRTVGMQESAHEQCVSMCDFALTLHYAAVCMLAEVASLFWCACVCVALAQAVAAAGSALCVACLSSLVCVGLLADRLHAARRLFCLSGCCGLRPVEATS